MDESFPHHKGNETHILREMMLTGQSLMAVFSRQVGMPPARLLLFRTLAIEAPEGIGVMALSRKLGVNAAAITRQINELESRGLIERQSDNEDARRHTIKLSEKGLDAFVDFHERMHRFEEQLRNGVSDEDLATAIRVLGQIRSTIENMS
jgi:MarR family transcriptional regulator for hemolysin